MWQSRSNVIRYGNHPLQYDVNFCIFVFFNVSNKGVGCNRSMDRVCDSQSGGCGFHPLLVGSVSV